MNQFHAAEMREFLAIGCHGRGEPDSNGYTSFEVYRVGFEFFWTALDDESPVGFEHGPFTTATEAYDNASN